MNPELSSCSSSTLDSIRKAGIGRRGGVKVRGGRLPPVQIHNVVSKKKSVAPKIPQKRSQVKKEEIYRNDFNELPFKLEGNFRGERGRDHKRGRGRGSKVYIQTEGTLFGEGPTLMKKEKQYSNYERISFSKSSKNSGIKREEKIDPGSIDFLLEFDYAEDESDTENELKPIKYPVSKAVKREIKHDIKQEIKQEFKQDIGFENLSIEEVRPFIKKEPVSPPLSPIKNNFKPMSSKYFTPIADGTDNLVNNLMDEMKKREDVGVMFLIQLPDSFPFSKERKDSEIAPNEKHATSILKVQNDKMPNEEEKKSSKLSARDLEEGFIGKLQFLKSGKVRLLMGSVKIYLEEGSSDFASEAVSIPIKGKNGELIVLGKITHKMILQPKFSDITDN